MARNYNSNYNSNNSNNNRQGKKKSGAVSGFSEKSKKPFVRGWNASKTYGLVTFIASPYNGTGQHESRNGKVWENWVVSVQPKMGKSFLESCLYDTQTKKVIIPNMGLVLNPNVRNGGYCGRFGGNK